MQAIVSFQGNCGSAGSTLETALLTLMRLTLASGDTAFGSKKDPQAVYALGVPELLPQLGSYLAGRRGVGGRGAARSAYMHER